MAYAIISATDTTPDGPPADFIFEIDFMRGAGSAARVFAASHDFIRACEAIDAELVRSIDVNITTQLVLEEVLSGSIKSFIRNTLELVEDDALKELKWKSIVGTFLVKAKYAILRWADSPDAETTLPILREEISRLASATDVRHLPDYTQPSAKALLRACANFQNAKRHLIEGDRAIFRGNYAGAQDLELNLSAWLPLEKIENLAVTHIISSGPSEMILPVKKPDYLGDSRWQLRLGQRTVEAKIEDLKWLRDFQNRAVDVRPGDAIRCVVTLENRYGHDNELVSERISVIRVIEVLQDRSLELEFPLESNIRS